MVSQAMHLPFRSWYLNQPRFGTYRLSAPCSFIALGVVYGAQSRAALVQAFPGSRDDSTPVQFCMTEALSKPSTLKPNMSQDITNELNMETTDSLDT